MPHPLPHNAITLPHAPPLREMPHALSALDCNSNTTRIPTHHKLFVKRVDDALIRCILVITTPQKWHLILVKPSGLYLLEQLNTWRTDPRRADEKTEKVLHTR